MNYKLHQGNFLLMDNKHRKLFVIKQSKGCKFVPKMHQNTFGGPLVELMLSLRPSRNGGPTCNGVGRDREGRGRKGRGEKFTQSQGE